jgi:DNA-binding transcriptional MerR regulator
MRIGELADQSGLTAPTVRFYERQGLLPRPIRAGNGYREYTRTDLDRARVFARFRELGLEAAIAARLADQCATDRCETTWAELPPLLADQRATIARRIAELSDLDARLAALQAMTSTGQSIHSTPIRTEETPMLECTCDDGTCCPPTGPWR